MLLPFCLLSLPFPRYDSSADIWSFGITLLELARGRPPLAKCNPMRVVLSIMQNPAPGLDEDSKEKHFSKVCNVSCCTLRGLGDCICTRSCMMSEVLLGTMVSPLPTGISARQLDC